MLWLAVIPMALGQGAVPMLSEYNGKTKDDTRAMKNARRSSARVQYLQVANSTRGLCDSDFSWTQKLLSRALPFRSTRSLCRQDLSALRSISNHLTRPLRSLPNHTPCRERLPAMVLLRGAQEKKMTSAPSANPPATSTRPCASS